MAEITPVPHYPWTVDSTHWVGVGHIRGLAHYELMSDNILDLSHIEYLHPLLGSDAVSRAKVEVTSTPNTVVTTRRMTHEHLSEPLARTYRTQGAAVQRELEVEWRAPALMELTVVITPEFGEDREPRGSRTLHLFTPESERSTHYFYVSGMRSSDNSEETAQGFRNALERVFVQEDKPMIDAQQARIGYHVDITDLRPAMLPIDKAPLLARRKLQQMIAAEAASKPADTSADPDPIDLARIVKSGSPSKETAASLSR